MVCCMPPAHKDIRSIPDFLWSGVKLPIWHLAFLLTITCVSDFQVGHASLFQTSKFQYLSNYIKNSSRRWVLTLAISLWKFGSPLGVQLPKWEFTWDVSVHSHVVSHSRVSLLACSLANPCLGHEPKAKVTTIRSHTCPLKPLFYSLNIF
jgi:hypothetical protein